LKGLLSSFKEPSSQKIIMERELLGGVGGGGRKGKGGSRQFVFLGRNFSRYSELDITVEHSIHILWMSIHELSFMNLQLDELS
jgi:hypothetical protein